MKMGSAQNKCQHSEESRKILLRTGNVSLDQQLGSYYIDMRPSEIHYTQNIYCGDFDSNGVPRIGGENGLFYSAVTVAQYGFIVHAQYLESGDSSKLKTLEQCVLKLVEMAEITDHHCVWWEESDYPRYSLKAPWASCMTQGEVISLFLRYYQVSNDEAYLILAEKAYRFLSIPVSEGGVRKIDENGDLWLEEYPSEPSSYVLNGFIYAIFGLYDLYRVTNNEEVKKDIDACLLTLRNNLDKFDSGYWSYYDLMLKELVRYYYQKNVHVPQMEVLYLLTDDPIFLFYKKKWSRKLGRLNFLFVQVMYRVLPRYRKLFRK